LTILDRYASAVRSANLKSDANTSRSDVDVLGAAGLAAKRHQLAIALARLFCGDNRASSEIVEMLASMVWGKAQAQHVELKRVQADDMARAVLAWHRDGICKTCSGHGFQLIHGAPAVGDTPCPACHGQRRIPFERQFHPERRQLACWLLAEVEREQAKAGPAALAALAPRLNLP
jgi:hypothetical protein